VRTAEIKIRAALQPAQLELAGSLALDPGGFVRLHSRFPGEVLEVAVKPANAESVGTFFLGPFKEAQLPNVPARKEVQLPNVPARGNSAEQLRYLERLLEVSKEFDDLRLLEQSQVGRWQTGYRVRKGDLLAVIRSDDLAMRRAAFVGRLIDGKTLQDKLEWAEKMMAEGTMTKKSVDEAKRRSETHRSDVAAAERRLRLWGMNAEELDALKKEADGLSRGAINRDPEILKKWARVELRSPLDGWMIEKNIIEGEVVDASQVVFQIANLDRLIAIVNAPEADLPILQQLKPEQRRWTIRVPSNPGIKPVSGSFDRIGPMTDPNLHTAPLRGMLDNPAGQLRAGQSIVATIVLTRPAEESVIPAEALVEEAGRAYIFVQPDIGKAYYTQRQVVIVRRDNQRVHIRSVAGGQKLRPGDRIVTRGALELRATFADLRAEQK
jgi:cobalt-zinc-cadmium efflux system membrane fusion protein